MGADEPKFLDSYKGRIIKAIAIDGARTWGDLQELTGFNPKTINGVLSELFSIDAIYKTALLQNSQHQNSLRIAS